MNDVYDSEQNMMAAEYVLGTLRGEDRTHFKRELMNSCSLRELTSFWEQQLNAMGESIAPISPRKSVLKRIEKRLGFMKSANNGYSFFLFNPVLAYCFATFTLALFLYFNGNNMQLQPYQTAVFNYENQAVFIVNIDKKSMSLVATKALPKLDNKDYELWVIVEGTPKSLGVISQTGLGNILIPEWLQKTELSTMAISIEDKGGSINGEPAEVKFVTNTIEI